MSYQIKEIFYTLQGEGGQAGRPAVFCRFSGCNLWSGRESGRARAVCSFCDTDFVGTDGTGGGTFRDTASLTEAVRAAWKGEVHARAVPMVVCTGGEPLLQLDQQLVDSFHAAGFYVAVETNGTRPAPAGLDWICVSPKAGTTLTITEGDELKLVYPQPEAPPARFENLGFRKLRLQPMDGPDLVANTRSAIEYCLNYPQWQLSVQSHKYLGIR
ncbi:7-carboxy-7-deazaguanine synthase [Nocardia brasiliensis]|uniref:7-carboxy-7-deazaguanine synthase n=1 Tax=Nocardia brasiliensis (strain ATCC 700358 / HUJEG-1) TaxID=1133849 RepID=K0F0H8_NOCB7|nr:7-carboxy-7-deazaguanine synthase [Nocardia brasiliensis]AFU02655.1 organic radical activating enzyme [Nocardia brasiliensis ATCC 700358]OCF84775.1 7-carboxy-7-deazaguanine synthase [Nocardia brasiliensis]